MGTPFQFRDKEAARKSAMTMMAKPFNAGKKFILTTQPVDDQPLAESTGPVTHRIGLTVTDPNHPMVSKRKEAYQKSVRVNGPDREKAINSAIAHARRKGYQVHDHHYLGTVDEAQLDELEKHECGHCHGTGRMVRDPDIGTDQECFVCDGTGYVNDEQDVAEGAPELLKKEMPTHRHAEKLLAHNGVSKDDPDYHHHLNNTIKHLRQFGNIDLINKSDEQGVAEGSDRIAANKQDRLQALENKLKAKGYARTKDSDGGEYQYRWTRDGAPTYVVNYRSGANGYAEFWKEQGVAEGLSQTLRKVVPGYAKREIDKKMDAEKFGKTDVDRDANFQRYKKIQDKLKEQGVNENAEELSVGDPVIISGQGIEFEGKTGDIDSFGDMKRFVVVNLYNHGRHSFHSSDVSYNDYADREDDLDEDMYQYDAQDPYNSEFAPRAGMGRMTLRGWKQQMIRRTAELAQQMSAAGQDIDKSALWDNVHAKLKSMNMDPIAQEIEQAQAELEKIRQRGGVRSRAFNK
jgi:hypothetical protein